MPLRRGAETRLSKLFRDIRRAEIVRREQQSQRVMPSASPRANESTAEDVPADPPYIASAPPGNDPDNPLNLRLSAEGERRALAAARARRASESAGAAQANARADSDRNAA